MAADRSSLAGLADKAAGLLAGLTIALGLGWAADLYRSLGLNLYNEQFLAAGLGLALASAYLRQAARPGGRPAVAFGFSVAALAALGLCGYIAWAYPVLLTAVVFKPLFAVVAGGVLLVLVLDAARRAAGWALPVVALLFLTLTLVGEHLPSALEGRPVAIDRMLVYLLVDPAATLGLPLMVTVTIVTAFVFLGSLLGATGGSAAFTDLAVASVGRYRGGSAKIAVVGSALFGSVSGSAVANVVATGVVTIPLMRKGGYSPAQAAGIEAAASTGGQLLPPVMGAAAFLMAEFLQISYGTVLLAALLPALLFYTALFIQCDLIAAREGVAPVQEEITASAAAVGRAAWPFALPFAVLLFAMFALNRSPETAALWGGGVLAVVGFVRGYRGRRLTLAALVGAFADAGRAAVEIILIAAVAGVIIGLINLSGLGYAFSLLMSSWGGGQLLPALAITAVVSIVLGMGMPTVGVYVLLATLMAPNLVELGATPIAAHLFVLYFGMLSMITPPVAIAAFAAAAVADARQMQAGLEAMRAGWMAYAVPFLFVLSPSLLLEGAWWQIALSLISALAGAWLVTAAVVGYALGRLGPIRRLLYAAAGLLVLVPLDAFPGAAWTDLVGALAAAVLLATDHWRKAGGGLRTLA